MTESAKHQSQIVIEHRAAPSEDVRALIGELDHELAAHYEQSQRHGLSVDAVFQPHIRFFVARKDGELAGCGGVALFDDLAEVKRMYVRPAARGSGVAEAILTRLIAEAAGEGLSSIRLETGVHQHAAIRFYRRHGFTPCEAFGDYLAMPPEDFVTSVFLERRIAAK